MRLTLPILLSFIAVACNDPLNPSLPGEPSDGLSADPDCESWTDDEGEEFFIEGATRYLVVDFDLNKDDTLTGTLKLMLFANQEWKDYGEDDCQVQWIASGTVSDETGSCGACNQMLDVNYALDMTQTNCPPDFYEGYEQASESYDILFRESGDEATIYWSGSGNIFTDNAWATNKRVWGHSDPACNWFGSSN
jgi:hypothetical protein